MRLMQGDCLERMREIPDNSVDMVLCDLPYGVTENGWDKPIPFEPLWEQYLRVCKENAAIVLFSQMPFTVDLVNSQRKLFRYEWIYQKSQKTGFLNANRTPLKAHENILVFYRRLPVYHPQFTYSKPYKRALRNGNGPNYNVCIRTPTENLDGRRYPSDVITFNNASLRDGHPNQKPVELCEYLIRTYTDAGGAF